MLVRHHTTHHRNGVALSHAQVCHGFTLIELSMVLVIIGLVAGGVLIGKELITGFKLRSVVTDFEKFRTATFTFKIKYNAIPGDMLPAEAAQFGLFQVTAPCGNPCTLGDGIVSYSGAAPSVIYEQNIYWRHLSDAGLLAGNYGNALRADGSPDFSPATSEQAEIWNRENLPIVHYTNRYWLPVSNLIRYFYDASTATYSTGIMKQTYFYIGANIINNPELPSQLYFIDEKMDDGKPNTGKMYNHLYGASWSASPTSGNCLYGGSSAFHPDVKYNTISDHSGHEYIWCVINMEAGF